MNPWIWALLGLASGGLFLLLVLYIRTRFLRKGRCPIDGSPACPNCPNPKIDDES